MVYELAGRVVSDCGIQSDGPRQRASAAATPIANLLQSMKPQSARTADAGCAPLAAAVEVEAVQPKQQMDLKPHKVMPVVMLLLFCCLATLR